MDTTGIASVSGIVNARRQFGGATRILYNCVQAESLSTHNGERERGQMHNVEPAPKRWD
jgi:hypothetical protein